MQFISFDKNDIVNGRSENIIIDDTDCFLALYNCNVYWVIPKVCSKCADIPEHTQYLLWKKNDGGYGIMLPLTDGDIKAALQGREKTEFALHSTALFRAANPTLPSFYISTAVMTRIL